MRFAIHIGLIALISLFISGSSKGETTIDSLFQAAVEQVGKVSRKESIKAFRAILSRDDEYAPAYNALANLYLQINTVNDRQRAAQMILKAIMIDPNNAEYRLTRGKIWWAQGFRSRALSQYENVNEKHPNNTEALDGEGMYLVYEFLALKDGRRDFGKYAQEAKQEAIQVLRKSIQLDGTNQKPYYLLGILYFEDKYWDAFHALMQALRTQYPDDKNALLFCGLAAYQIGEFNESHDYYQRALDLMSLEERELLESIDLLVPKEDHASRDTTQTIDALLEREMFWKSQDPLYLSKFNERKMEHFGRMAYSNLRFRRFSDNVEGWQTDMGKTYIKFGRYRNRKNFFFVKEKMNLMRFTRCERPGFTKHLRSNIVGMAVIGGGSVVVTGLAVSVLFPQIIISLTTGAKHLIMLLDGEHFLFPVHSKKPRIIYSKKQSSGLSIRISTENTPCPIRSPLLKDEIAYGSNSVI